MYSVPSLPIFEGLARETRSLIRAKRGLTTYAMGLGFLSTLGKMSNSPGSNVYHKRLSAAGWQGNKHIPTSCKRFHNIQLMRAKLFEPKARCNSLYDSVTSQDSLLPHSTRTLETNNAQLTHDAINNYYFLQTHW